MKQQPVMTVTEPGAGMMPPAGQSAANIARPDTSARPQAVPRFIPNVYGKPQTKPTTVFSPQQTMPPEPVIGEHVRGGEPKRIGELMEPIQRIIRHPDRNRLMADFFKRFW